ncbi:MAG: hypothetical protein JOZ05_16235 [Acetobacteraceae bacterium]|nr:hypothetical protein [Acetobacteraceae bacterium]
MPDALTDTTINIVKGTVPALEASGTAITDRMYQLSASVPYGGSAEPVQSYLCRPRPFLRAMVGGLARKGVALGNIRYEFFGPADELLAG